MNEESAKTCSRCGAAVPADAPEGLCPRCLGALNLAAETAMPGEAVPAQPPPSPDDIAPHFPQLEILECLGRGGMGVVYKARQKALGRPVALKILAPEREKDPEFAARFIREAQALARLDHPHIVTIHDFGQADGFFYLLMEFVDGVNLRQAMRAGRFTPQQALAVVPQICEALQFAHDRGIVHRDIKPENILLDRQGRVKIADFGVAKILGRDAPAASEGGAEVTGLTQAQGVVGTPRYMAPEQVTHPLDVDHRADIYSLGVVFYEMLTGDLPAARIEPPSRKVVVDVRLDEVVLRALEKAPERRYQQAGEVGTIVETIATTPSGPPRWPAGRSGMVRLVELFFDIQFTSRRAIQFINVSALGFLGFLSGLQHFPFPGMERCSGFSGLFGFFGFIGAGFLAEMIARHRAKTPAVGDPAASEEIRNQVKGPATGLLVTGILNCIAIPSVGTRIPPAAPGVVTSAAKQSLRWMLFGDHPERRHINWPFLLFFLSTIGLGVNGLFLAIELVPWMLNIGGNAAIPGGVWQKLLWLAACVLGRRTAMVALNWSPKTVGWAAFTQVARGVQVRTALILFLTMIVAAVVAGGLGFLSPWMRTRFLTVFSDVNSLSNITRTVVWIAIAAATGAFVIHRIWRAAKKPNDGAQREAAPDWRLWSPFQPPLVRKICAHMTEAEKRDALKRGLLFGLWNAMTFFGPFFCVMFLSLPRPMGWIYGAAILIVGLSFYPLWRKMEREFLCSTAWARAQGIKPGQLKGRVAKRLLWAIPAALIAAVAVAFAAALAFCTVAGVIDGWQGARQARIAATGKAGAPGLSADIGPRIALVKVEGRRAVIEGRGSPEARFIVSVGKATLICFLKDSSFTAVIERPIFGRGFNCTVNDSRGNSLLKAGNSRIGPMMEQRGRIVFRDGTPAAEPDGTYVIGEFRPEAGGTYPMAVSIQTSNAPAGAAQPKATSDRVAVEDLALRLLAAIRDREDAVLRDLAADRVPGWRDALPQFAFELRERVAHMTGEPFALFPADSLVAGDSAAVRCTGPDALKGAYLVLGFVRTPAGWRNWNLRNSPPEIPLQRHFDAFNAQLEGSQPPPSTDRTKEDP